MSTSVKRKRISLSLYEKRLKQALKLYGHPARLGAETPLASPYFLANAIKSETGVVDAQMLGKALRREILCAAQELWQGPLPDSTAALQEAILRVRQTPESDQYAYVVLELRCFQQWIRPRRASDVYEQSHLLPGSKSQHYRDFDVAVQKLGRALLHRLCPTLRLEHPLPPSQFTGYAEQIAQGVLALRNGQTVAVTGPSGAGKTSLSTLLAQRYPELTTFWFTLRPALNDNLSSLLFALGYFLQKQGACNLWQYLTASGGTPDSYVVATAFLRQDLSELDAAPLLCFDELEHLYAADPSHLSPARVQIYELLESLRGATPMLLISQRPVLEADEYIELRGLTVAQTEQLWAANNLPLTSREAAQLSTFTSGNPRLLVLCLALQRSGESIGDVLASATQSLSLLPIFARVWKRLPPEERRLLQRLSVFRSPAPVDGWSATELQSVTQRRLVEHDEQGGVAVIPALREVILGEIVTERRELLHREAALIRLERAEYTAAAYHFWQGYQEDKAVQAWFPHRQMEVQRGQAAAALIIFEGVSRHSLKKTERKALDIIRAELNQLVGELRRGLSSLESSDWQEDDESTARLLQLRGEFLEALGYPDAAAASYTEGIYMTARLMRQMAHLHHLRGAMHFNQRDLKQSWSDLWQTESTLHVMRGQLQEEAGDYQKAQQSYLQAVETSRKANDKLGEARAERILAALSGRLHRVDEALAHSNRAMAVYEQIDSRINQEITRSNLAFIYVQAQQFEAAIEPATRAYQFFRRVGDPHWTAVNAANLAEAYFELGKLGQAEQYALEVLDIEERWAYPYAHFTLGQVRRSQANRDAAEAHFRESLEMAQRNEDVFMEAYARRALGNVQVEGGQVEAGRGQIDEALAIFRRLSIEGEIAETESLLERVAAGAG